MEQVERIGRLIGDDARIVFGVLLSAVNVARRKSETEVVQESLDLLWV